MAKRNRRSKNRRRAMRAGVFAGAAGGQKTEMRAEIAGSRASRRAERPTGEQMSRGVWSMPSGMGKQDLPVVNRTPDMIGRLFEDRKITGSQEQAARTFQQLRAAFLAALGTRGYGSCLADNQAGYDSGDGDGEAEAAYNSLVEKIGRSKAACLIREVNREADQKPVNLRLLRLSLDAVVN